MLVLLRGFVTVKLVRADVVVECERCVGRELTAARSVFITKARKLLSDDESFDTAPSVLNSSVRKRSWRETKRPDQYAEGCDEVICSGFGSSSVTRVLVLLVRDAEVEEYPGKQSLDELDVSRLLVEDEDALRD